MRGATKRTERASSSTQRVSLVTGAATGIGRSAALALAHAGFDVAINYSRSEAAAKETAAQAQRPGHRRCSCQCDVSDEAGVRAMVDAVGARFGRLDVLVNNAGVTAAWKPKDLETLSLDDWDRVFAVNVRGLFQVTRAAVPLLRKGERPCIVNTASIVGLRPGPAATALRGEQGGGGRTSPRPWRGTSGPRSA